MKKLIGMVVVLAALILGSYYAMGIVTEKKLSQSLSQVNSQYASSGLQIELKNYQRHFFTSKADLKVLVHIPERAVESKPGESTLTPAQDLVFEEVLDLYHGPFVLADKQLHFGLGYTHSILHLPESMRAQFKALFSEKSEEPTLDLGLLVTYLGGVELQAEVPAFKLFEKNPGQSLSFEGLQVRMVTKANGKVQAGSVHMKAMEMNKEKQNVQFGGVSASYRLEQNASGLYTGDSEILFPLFEASEEGKKIASLQDIRGQVDSVIEQNRFSSHLNFSLNQLMVQDKVYGPAMLKMAIKDLDAVILAKLNQESNRIQQLPLAERKSALLALLPDLMNLFAKGAAFEVSELSVVVPEGNIQGNLLVSLPNAAEGNPFDMLKKIKGEGHVRMPVALVKTLMATAVKAHLAQQPATAAATSSHIEPATSARTGDSVLPNAPQPAADLDKQAAEQVEQKLASLLKSQVLQQKADQYLVQLKFENAEFTINGQPFNPAMLQF